MNRNNRIIAAAVIGIVLVTSACGASPTTLPTIATQIEPTSLPTHAPQSTPVEPTRPLTGTPLLFPHAGCRRATSRLDGVH